jgi:hypothetical protein
VPLLDEEVQKLPPNFRTCQHGGNSILNDRSN